MVLRSICLDFLAEGRWAEAFIQCRKHKIDFNLLVDFDPQRFLGEGVRDFVKQINSNDHFFLVSSSLRPKDVTKELYPITSSWKRLTGKDNLMCSRYHLVISTCINCWVISVDVSKINQVCELMVLEFTHKQVQWEHINSILMAFVCKKSPDYKSALQILSKMKAQDGKVLDDAVKYIIFLSDANELYNFALSVYDLSLVILTAQHSQKDPKEYLPFLQSLRDLEPEMRKFKIDDQLGNYSLAVRHLSAAGEDQFDAVLNYTTLHSLYAEALDMYSGNSAKTKVDRVRQIWTRVEDIMIIALAYCGLLEELAIHKNLLISSRAAPSADAYAAMIQHAHEATDNASAALARTSNIELHPIHFYAT
ncbi:hypothetical protein O181_055109 [Austropuccinia psidii MF-1]|uniref:Uncharacterized protein n=1 Tax=Austropuccinia psidii MF-1 TaxID=1389203 RepID=A0A9Q3HUA1_9BASI|nr:hypothetical protein [Austropuccinia psidii MF-1]